MTWIKICGITTAEAADAAVRSHADYAGLVFHPASPRARRPEVLRSLAFRLKGRVRVVALLADPDDEAVAMAVSTVEPDFLQLHGKETPARIAQLRSRFNLPVIKALPIAEPKDFAELSAFEQAADMILFDAKAPEAATRPGGHGAARAAFLGQTTPCWRQ